MFSELSLPVPSQQMTRYLGPGFSACSRDEPPGDATAAIIAEMDGSEETKGASPACYPVYHLFTLTTC